MFSQPPCCTPHPGIGSPSVPRDFSLSLLVVFTAQSPTPPNPHTPLERFASLQGTLGLSFLPSSFTESSLRSLGRAAFNCPKGLSAAPPLFWIVAFGSSSFQNEPTHLLGPKSSNDCSRSNLCSWFTPDSFFFPFRLLLVYQHVVRF